MSEENRKITQSLESQESEIGKVIEKISAEKPELAQKATAAFEKINNFVTDTRLKSLPESFQEDYLKEILEFLQKLDQTGVDLMELSQTAQLSRILTVAKTGKTKYEIESGDTKEKIANRCMNADGELLDPNAIPDNFKDQDFFTLPDGFLYFTAEGARPNLNLIGRPTQPADKYPTLEIKAKQKLLTQKIQFFRGKSDISRYHEEIIEARNLWRSAKAKMPLADQINLEEEIIAAENKIQLLETFRGLTANMDIEFHDDDWVQLEDNQIEVNVNGTIFDEELNTYRLLEQGFTLKEAFSIIQANKEYAEHGVIGQKRIENKKSAEKSETLSVSAEEYLKNRQAIIDTPYRRTDFFQEGVARDKMIAMNETGMAYVPGIKQMIDDFGNWEFFSGESELASKMVTATAQTLREAKTTLEKLKTQKDTNPEQKETYEAFRDAYQADVKLFAEIIANVGDDYESEGFRGKPDMVNEFTTEAMASMDGDQAYAWVKSTMERIDDNDYQSTELKTVYQVFANNLKSGIKRSLQVSKGKLETVAYQELCMKFADLFVDEGEVGIDSDLIDQGFAEEILAETANMDEMVTQFFENSAEKIKHPVRYKIEKVTTQLDRFTDIDPKTKSRINELTAQTAEKSTTKPNLFAAYSELSLYLAILDGEINLGNGNQAQADTEAFKNRMQRELGEMELEFMHDAHTKFRGFLETKSHYTGIDVDQYGLDQYGVEFTGKQKEAFAKWIDYAGTGNGNWAIDSGQTALMVTKMAATITAAIAISIVSAGTLSPMAAALVGGAAMTASNSLINQTGFEGNPLGFAKAYGLEYAANAVSLGTASYINVTSTTLQLGSAGILRQAGGVREIFKMAGKKGALAKFGEIDDALNIAGKKMLGISVSNWKGMGIEMAADFVVGGATNMAQIHFENQIYDRAGSLLSVAEQAFADPMTFAFMGMAPGMKWMQGFKARMSKAPIDQITGIDAALRTVSSAQHQLDKLKIPRKIYLEAADDQIKLNNLIDNHPQGAYIEANILELKRGREKFQENWKNFSTNYKQPRAETVNEKGKNIISDEVIQTLKETNPATRYTNFTKSPEGKNLSETLEKIGLDEAEFRERFDKAHKLGSDIIENTIDADYDGNADKFWKAVQKKEIPTYGNQQAEIFRGKIEIFLFGERLDSPDKFSDKAGALDNEVFNARMEMASQMIRAGHFGGTIDKIIKNLLLRFAPKKIIKTNEKLLNGDERFSAENLQYIINNKWADQPVETYEKFLKKLSERRKSITPLLENDNLKPEIKTEIQTQLNEINVRTRLLSEIIEDIGWSEIIAPEKRPNWVKRGATSIKERARKMKNSAKESEKKFQETADKLLKELKDEDIRATSLYEKNGDITDFGKNSLGAMLNPRKSHISRLIIQFFELLGVSDQNWVRKYWLRNGPLIKKYLTRETNMMYKEILHGAGMKGENMSEANMRKAMQRISRNTTNRGHISGKFRSWIFGTGDLSYIDNRLNRYILKLEKLKISVTGEASGKTFKGHIDAEVKKIKKVKKIVENEIEYRKFRDEAGNADKFEKGVPGKELRKHSLTKTIFSSDAEEIGKLPLKDRELAKKGYSLEKIFDEFDNLENLEGITKAQKAQAEITLAMNDKDIDDFSEKIDPIDKKLKQQKVETFAEDAYQLLKKYIDEKLDMKIEIKKGEEIELNNYSMLSADQVEKLNTIYIWAMKHVRDGQVESVKKKLIDPMELPVARREFVYPEGTKDLNVSYLSVAEQETIFGESLEFLYGPVRSQEIINSGKTVEEVIGSELSLEEIKSIYIERLSDFKKNSKRFKKVALITEMKTLYPDAGKADHPGEWKTEIDGEMYQPDPSAQKYKPVERIKKVEVMKGLDEENEILKYLNDLLESDTTKWDSQTLKDIETKTGGLFSLENSDEIKSVDDIDLTPKEKEIILDIVAKLSDPSRWHELPFGGLVGGPNRVGKSLTPKLMAYLAKHHPEFKDKFIVINLKIGAFFDNPEYRGAGGKVFKRVYKMLEKIRKKNPELGLFVNFDEADAVLVPAKGENSGDVKKSLTYFKQLLQDRALQKNGVYMLCATNHPKDVDRQLLTAGRLSDTHLRLPPFDLEGNKRLIAAVLKNKTDEITAAGIDPTQINMDRIHQAVQSKLSEVDYIHGGDYGEGVFTAATLSEFLKLPQSQRTAARYEDLVIQKIRGITEKGPDKIQMIHEAIDQMAKAGGYGPEAVKEMYGLYPEELKKMFRTERVFEFDGQSYGPVGTGGNVESQGINFQNPDSPNHGTIQSINRVYTNDQGQKMMNITVEGANYDISVERFKASVRNYKNVVGAGYGFETNSATTSSTTAQPETSATIANGKITTEDGEVFENGSSYTVSEDILFSNFDFPAGTKATVILDQNSGAIFIRNEKGRQKKITASDLPKLDPTTKSKPKTVGNSAEILMKSIKHIKKQLGGKEAYKNLKKKPQDYEIVFVDGSIRNISRIDEQAGILHFLEVDPGMPLPVEMPIDLNKAEFQRQLKNRQIKIQKKPGLDDPEGTIKPDEPKPDDPNDGSGGVKPKEQPTTDTEAGTELSAEKSEAEISDDQINANFDRAKSHAFGPKEQKNAEMIDRGSYTKAFAELDADKNLWAGTEDDQADLATLIRQVHEITLGENTTKIRTFQKSELVTSGKLTKAGYMYLLDEGYCGSGEKSKVTFAVEDRPDLLAFSTGEIIPEARYQELKKKYPETLSAENLPVEFRDQTNPETGKKETMAILKLPGEETTAAKKAQRTALKKQRETFQKEKAILNEQIGKLETGLANNKKDIEKLVTEKISLETEKARISAEIQNKQIESNELIAKIATREQEVASLKSQLQTAKEISNAKTSDEAITTLQSNLKTKGQELITLKETQQQQIEATEALNTELNKVKTQLKQISAEKLQLETEIKTLKKSLNAEQQEKQVLETQNQEINKQLTGLETEKQNLIQKNQKLTTQNENISAEKFELEGQINIKETAIQSAKTAQNIANKKAAEATKKQKEAEEKLAEANEKLEAVLAENKVLEQEIKANKTSVSEIVPEVKVAEISAEKQRKNPAPSIKKMRKNERNMNVEASKNKKIEELDSKIRAVHLELQNADKKDAIYLNRINDFVGIGDGVGQKIETKQKSPPERATFVAIPNADKTLYKIYINDTEHAAKNVSQFDQFTRNYFKIDSGFEDDVVLLDPIKVHLDAEGKIIKIEEGTITRHKQAVEIKRNAKDEGYKPKAKKSAEKPPETLEKNDFMQSEAGETMDPKKCLYASTFTGERFNEPITYEQFNALPDAEKAMYVFCLDPENGKATLNEHPLSKQKLASNFVYTAGNIVEYKGFPRPNESPVIQKFADAEKRGNEWYIKQDSKVEVQFGEIKVKTILDEPEKSAKISAENTENPSLKKQAKNISVTKEKRITLEEDRSYRTLGAYVKTMSLAQEIYKTFSEGKTNKLFDNFQEKTKEYEKYIKDLKKTHSSKEAAHGSRLYDIFRAQTEEDKLLGLKSILTRRLYPVLSDTLILLEELKNAEHFGLEPLDETTKQAINKKSQELRDSIQANMGIQFNHVELFEPFSNKYKRFCKRYLGDENGNILGEMYKDVSVDDNRVKEIKSYGYSENGKVVKPTQIVLEEI